MGAGDDIIATGLARNLSPGKRAAFGDGGRILWGPFSREIFKNNPRIALPHESSAKDLQWIKYFKGHRIYNKPGQSRWIWNYDFKVTPGEIVFDVEEQIFGGSFAQDFVLIEPNLPWQKSVAINKDWGANKFQLLADHLRLIGADVVQFSYGKRRLAGVRVIETPTFRHALAALSRARFAIVPEGGLHHGAAALGIPAIVLFGGFIPPAVMGYDGHVNLTGSSSEACGSYLKCKHCVDAMTSITVDEVFGLAKKWL